jgi:hypothetical protein
MKVLKDMKLKVSKVIHKRDKYLIIINSFNHNKILKPQKKYNIKNNSIIKIVLIKIYNKTTK